MSDYYARIVSTFIDGSPIFKTEADEKNEREISEAISSNWGCECGSFGKLAPIDWYFVRDGRLVGIGELKTAGYVSTKYGNAILNVRKWLALSLASVGLGVPAVFVVRFEDGDFWVHLSDIDAKNTRVMGLKKVMKSRNDREPCILVPVSTMCRLSTKP